MKRNDVISHLQIMHTWASFALEKDKNFFEEKHIEHIADWTNDALNMLKENEEEKKPRLLSVEELQSLSDRETICVEQLLSREDEERGYVTAKGWGVVCNSTGAEDCGLIVSIVGTFAPNYINRIPYKVLPKREKGNQTVVQYRFWTDKPTEEQSMEIPWD